MVLAFAENVSTAPLDPVEEDFEVLIDEPYFCLVRIGETHVAQVHSPVDLTELTYQLVGVGYTMAEVMAHEDGILEILVRPLGGLPVESPAEEQRTLTEGPPQKESVYA